MQVWYEVDRGGVTEARAVEGSAEEVAEFLRLAVREYGPVRIVHVEGEDGLGLQAGDIWSEA